METYEIHSEYVFDLQEMKNMVNNNQIHPDSDSVSITIAYEGDSGVFKAEVCATVVHFDSDGNRIISTVGPIYACPRPPGCGK